MATATQQRRLLAGNWKMNLDHQAGVELVTACAQQLAELDLPSVFCAPAIHLHSLQEAVAQHAQLHLGAQDVSAHESGAHTGEISAEQLRSVGCTYVIVGHSERRSDHHEAGQVLANKVDRALAHSLIPIYCFGESLKEREAGKQQDVVGEHLREGLGHLNADAMAHVVLAYEPVWAIGTGKTASPQQAQAMHTFVREWLKGRFGESCAAATTILYGGSVKPSNAQELFEQPDIDGGLIGGASLKSEDFVAIARALAA